MLCFGVHSTVCFEATPLRQTQGEHEMESWNTAVFGRMP